MPPACATSWLWAPSWSPSTPCTSSSGPGAPRWVRIALTVVVFGSILIGHPFTESYARHTAPAAVWHTRQFHAINQRISAVWGLAFLAGTISLLIAGSTGDRQVLLRVIVPFGA